MITQEMEQYLIFENMTADSNHYWFLARSANWSLYGLARIRKGQDDIHFISLPLELCGADSVFVDLLEADGKLYLVPKRSEYMPIYDTGNDTWSCVPIAKPDKDQIRYPYRINQKFSTAVRYKDYLYLFPNFYPAISRYHLKTGKMEYLYKSREELEKYPFHESFGFCDHVRVEGTRVVFFSKCYGMLLQFDLETCTLEIIEKFGLQEIFCCFEDDGENYWLVSLHDTLSVIKCNKKSREKKLLPIQIPGFIPKRVPFFWTAVSDESVWMLPGLSNMGLKIDIHTETITEAKPFNLSSMEEYSEAECWKFSFLKKIDNELFAFDTTSNMLIHYVSQSKWERKGYGLTAYEQTRLECKQLIEMMEHLNMYRDVSAEKAEQKSTAGENIYLRCVAEIGK